jgi:Glycosyl hydrolases family 43/FlgD Ig-like domain
MRRSNWFACLVLFLLPSTSLAMQLNWSTGASNLNFAAARRCTLMVHTGPSENPLPSEWRLLWVTKNNAVPALAVRSETGSGADTARVCTLDLPGTPIEVAANEEEGQFCSPGSTSAAWARYIIDVPQGTNGRLQAVAFNPTNADSSTFNVIRSPEATINAGLTNSYPPAILHVAHFSQVYKYYFRILGIHLATVTTASLENSGLAWHVPLTISSQNDSVITCFGEGGRRLPNCALKVVSDEGGIDYAMLVADPPLSSPDSPAVIGHMVDPSLSIYPKDFAFYFQKGSSGSRDRFHLFYIRQPLASSDPNAAKGLGHGTSYDLTHWALADSTILHPRNAWDNLSTWAPYIVAVGDTFYMYYAGVGTNAHGHAIQQIGLATSTNLDDTTWVRIASPVLPISSVPWASHNTDVYEGQQLRDPFVMPHPDTIGVWLMLFTAVVDGMKPDMAIGLARSTDMRTWRVYPNPLWNTDYFGNRGVVNVEAPHLLRHTNGSGSKTWWLFYSAGATPVRLQYNQQAVIESVFADSARNATHWAAPDSLYAYLGYDTTFAGWDASEYTSATYYAHPRTAEYLAAYTGLDISIGQMTWTAGSPDAFTLGNPQVAAVNSPTRRAGAGLEFGIDELRLGSGRVRFRLQSQTPSAVHLSVMDIQGRCVKTLLDGAITSGAITITWDGKDSSGRRVGTGIYFARLTWAAGAKVIRVPLLR